MIDYDFEKAVNDGNYEEINNYLGKYDFENTRNKDNMTIIHYAAQEGLKNILNEIINFLKKSHKNYLQILSLVDNKSWNALYSAIDSTESGLPDIVEILVRNGIDVNYQDKKGISVLHLAAYKGQDDNVEYLIKNKADLNAKDLLGRTPISFAILEGQTNAIQALLDAGADYNIRDNIGDSLLHYAFKCKGNSLLYCIMLYEKGLDINTINSNSDTILILAAKSGVKNNLRLVIRLLESGANPNLKNKQGDSFYSIASNEALTDNSFVNSINLIGKHKSLLSSSENNSNLKEEKSMLNSSNMPMISIIVLLLIFFISKIINKQ